MTCLAKHTTYQPTKAEFRCPKCNAECGVWFIEEPASGGAENCAKLHSDDEVHCMDCHYGMSGRAFAALAMRKKNLIPCPTCKGRGVMDSRKTERK